MQNDTLGTLRARIAELETALKAALQRAEDAETAMLHAAGQSQELVRRIDALEALQAELVADKNQWFVEAAKACQRSHAAETALTRLRTLIGPALDGYHHVAHCVDCGEMSVDHCTEGQQAQAAVAVLEADLEGAKESTE